MEENLANQRRSYEKSALERENLKENPMHFFKTWFDEIEEADQEAENNAMTLGTVEQNGFPKNRIVLLKKFNDEGFVFYTNYFSEKGKAIAQNPNVTLSFFWPKLERQVIVVGKAEKVSDTTSNQYFASRPRGSRIGALVSKQSQPIEDRAVLEERKRRLEIEYQGKDILRPVFWGGYLVKPIQIEFWQGRPNRLHDRFLYTKTANSWEIERLAP